jgi:hypothetical protein
MKNIMLCGGPSHSQSDVRTASVDVEAEARFTDGVAQRVHVRVIKAGNSYEIADLQNFKNAWQPVVIVNRMEQIHTVILFRSSITLFDI